MKKVEYLIRYDWYGYEGTSCRNCEYVSEDLSRVYSFINDEKFREQELERLHSAGFIEKIHQGIYKRTIIETKIDYKQEPYDVSGSRKSGGT